MKILSLISLFALVSCAGWRLQNTDRVGQYGDDLKVDQKMKLNFKVLKYETYYNGELKESSLADQKKLEMIQDIKDAYIESGLFEFSEKNPDLTVEISITNKGSGSLNRALLTYFTVFLVPSSSETEYTVTTRFVDKENTEIGVITKSDVVVKWQQLFMVFAMPFKYPHKALKDTLVDLNRATIVEAYHDGFFREVIQ